MDFKVDGSGCDRRYHSYNHSLPAAIGCGAEEEDFEVVVERESQNTEIWVSTHGGGAMETETPTDPINNNSPSLFYSSSLDLIPPLPDFPCMSSSSSSSTTPTPSKPVNAFISTSSATSSLSSSSSATSSSASSSAGSSLVVFRSDNEFDDHNNSHLDVSYHQHQHHHHRRYGGPEQHHQHQQVKSGGDGVNLQNCWDEGQISHTHDFHYEENNRNNQLPPATKEEGDHDMMMDIEDVVECMNVMDDFDTMGLSLSQLMDETNEIWDPTPLFQDNNNNQTPSQPNNQTTHEDQQLLYQHPDQHHNYLHVDINHHNRTTTTTPTTTTTHHDDNNHPLPTIIDDDDDDQHHPFLFMEDDDDDDDEHQNTPPKRRLINQHNNQVVDGDDLAVVFFEWLKSNKELSISAEDLRSIKIKKSTIECAAKRLGGGKEGMKQLLKLVLQWVQNHHLHNKRLKSSSSSSVAEVDDDLLNPPLLNQQLVNNCPKPDNTNLMTQQQHPIDLAPPPPPPPNCYPNSTSWPVPPPPPPYVSDHIPNITPGYSPMVNYMNTPASDPYTSHITNTHYSHPPLIENSNVVVSSWPSQQPPPSYPPMIPHYNPMDPTSHFSPYTASQYPPPPPYQFFPGLSDASNLRQMGSSATKEARQKRMARQRRVFTHNHNRTTTQQHHHQNHHQQQNSQMMIHGGGGGAGMMMSDGGGIHHSTGGPWGYWPTNSRAGGVVVPTNGQMINPPIAQMQQQVPPSQEMERPTLRGNGSNSTKQTPGPDKSKLQGSKTEKNLKFLLQKVLKQSDVGNLGRIVLPKKEAETHLPELDARDGIPIAMEDIGTSRVWNMRYRFWPNNKSRMYLLENTGDFVRSNGLQEGDFIVIYSDVKCGKYMIRGVKVRTPQGPKPDSNKKQLQKIETPAAGLIC